MKIKEILTESSTDIVARFYKQASNDLDRQYNLQNTKIKEENSKYYEEFFQDWYKYGITPVFTQDVAESQTKFTTEPSGKECPSPGARGVEYIKSLAKGKP